MLQVMVKFYRSTSFGLSWTKITSGLFAAERSAIGVTPDAPNKVFLFATRQGNFEGFYVSINSGLDFTKKQQVNVFRTEAGRI